MHEEQNQEHWPVWATEPVKIVNPDPAWSEQGLKIIHQLRELLLPFKVTEIEHIGSTAIPNLSAKPIIDIMAKLESWDQLEQVVSALQPAGWNYVPPELDGREWRRFLVKVEQDQRKGHLHLMLKSDEHWDQQLLFRNRLREQPELIQQYDVLKRRLAMENQHDREAYTEAKTDFVQNVLNTGHPKD
jgi:GrpB-like predicted nucleotidyltransferase (UPF0157 family)